MLSAVITLKMVVGSFSNIWLSGFGAGVATPFCAPMETAAVQTNACFPMQALHDAKPRRQTRVRVARVANRFIKPCD